MNGTPSVRISAQTFEHNFEARILHRKTSVRTLLRSGAYYEENKYVDELGFEKAPPNHLGVQWADEPRDKAFPLPVFGLQTIYAIPEEKFRTLTKGGPEQIGREEHGVEDQTEFILEKYLQEFIVSNFDAIFKKTPARIIHGP